MKKFFLLLPLILLFHVVILFFLRFNAWPEMILWPYFFLKGLLPYQNIAMAHTPALIFDLVIFYKIFGVSLFNLKVFTWILILLTDLLIFWVTIRITKEKKSAIFALIFYVLWQPFFDGNGIWFDIVLAPLGLLIFYFSYRRQYLLAGIYIGLAILTKQTAFWFMLPVFFSFWLLNELKIKSVINFGVGMALPFTVFLVYLIKLNIWEDFYFWAINFGIGYLPHAPNQVKMIGLKQWLSLSVPFAALFPVLLNIWQNKKTEKSKLPILLFSWVVFAGFGIFPRFEYFHLQPALPFLAIISGLVILHLNLSYKKKSIWLVYLVLVILGTFYLQSRFYRLNWQKPERFFEKETVQVADWLKRNTAPGERIFILNSWDHLYALSDTLPAVSLWVPTLSWYMEYPGIQDKMVSDLSKNKPRLVVFEPYYDRGWGSGLGLYRPEAIDRFIQENYVLDTIIAGRFWILKQKE